MKIYLTAIFALSILCSCSQTPTIEGTFPQLANQEVKLKGFGGFETYTIDTAKISKDGRFSVEYQKKNHGMGVLIAIDNKPFYMILSGEYIELKGETLTAVNAIQILKGEENQMFGKYASEHPRREQALSAWGYLEKIYKKDSLFAKQ